MQVTGPATAGSKSNRVGLPGRRSQSDHVDGDSNRQRDRTGLAAAASGVDSTDPSKLFPRHGVDGADDDGWPRRHGHHGDRDHHDGDDDCDDGVGSPNPGSKFFSGAWRPSHHAPIFTPGQGFGAIRQFAAAPTQLAGQAASISGVLGGLLKPELPVGAAPSLGPGAGRAHVGPVAPIGPETPGQPATPSLLPAAVPPAAPSKLDTFEATSDNAHEPTYRAGYGEYLRTAGLGGIAAVAVPGFAGLLILTGAGGIVGYRQARAGHVVHSRVTSRFLG